MKPETDHHVAVLDGWRGLAVIGVLIDHFFGPPVVNLGRLGVEFFFVLSGRLMADILFVRRTPLRTFFPRRFSRVYPALFVFATVIFAIAQLFGQPFDREIPLTVYLSSLGFTINYVAIFWYVSAATDHLWSLAIEEHCYLLLGALAALSRWRPAVPVWWIVVGLIGAAIARGLYLTYGVGLSYHNTFWRTDVRGASILISVAFHLWLRRQPGRPWLLDRPMTPVAAVLGALLLNLDVVPDPVKYSLGTLLLAVGVTTLAQAPAPVTALFRNRWLTIVGLGSFSLYLWQQPFALIHDPLLRTASLGVVGLVAWASYAFVEQPARRTLNRLFAPGTAAPSAETPTPAL